MPVICQVDLVYIPPSANPLDLEVIVPGGALGPKLHISDNGKKCGCRAHLGVVAGAAIVMGTVWVCTAALACERRPGDQKQQTKNIM